MKMSYEELSLEQAILELTDEPQTPDQLLRQLSKHGIKSNRREIQDALSSLVERAQLMRAKGSRYAKPEHFGCFLGTFCGTGRSYSFVAPDAGGEDIFIPPHRDGGAWNGDRVLAHYLEKPVHRRGARGRDVQRREAEVYRILEEKHEELVGSLALRGKMVVFRADNGKYPDIVIGKKHLHDAKPGDHVAVQVVFRGGDKYLPQGVVTRVFGAADSMDASIAAVLHENDIVDQFPAEVLAEADRIGQTVTDADCSGRLDLRGLTLFTIDGDSAKDFDDAVSLEPQSDGTFRVGVHIADVSYYVRPGTQLNAEAFRRGTSVYYPGHVVPMLPFALSNGICSLNPDVDRLAFSVFVDLTADGARRAVSFHRSVIRSSARLTYNQVNLALSDQPNQVPAVLIPTLKQMNRMAYVLHDLRLARGALELNIPECEIECDESGKVSAVSHRDRGDAEHLIEEFMLLANEAVAEHLFKQSSACVYRVHESPDPVKLQEFARQARLFGFRLRDSELNDTTALQEVLRQSEGKDYQIALSTMLLRAMARARYAPDNLGHYGLAAKYYLHFTSPIRRYPDLVVHRMLAQQLAGQQSTKDDRTFCAEASIQSSDREVAADNAERQINKLYQALYLQQFIGEEFPGYVSGVTNFGIFVCLDNLIEGLVRLDSMPNDWFEYDPDRMILVGKRTGQRYYLGRRVRISVANASPTSGQIDFLLVPDEKK